MRTQALRHRRRDDDARFPVMPCFTQTCSMRQPDGDPAPFRRGRHGRPRGRCAHWAYSHYASRLGTTLTVLAWPSVIACGQCRATTSSVALLQDSSVRQPPPRAAASRSRSVLTHGASSHRRERKPRTVLQPVCQRMVYLGTPATASRRTNLKPWSRVCRNPCRDSCRGSSHR